MSDWWAIALVSVCNENICPFELQWTYSTTTGTTSGVWTAYPSGASEFTTVFIEVSLARSLVFLHFAEIKSVTTEYSAIYTDGSKDGGRVASTAVLGQQVYYARLPSASSVFSAEANAILLALKFVASSDKSKCMICSDSLSFLLAIESCKTQNPFILKIVQIYKGLVAIGKHIIFTWIPSHIGIHGNTVVDKEAKNALDDPVSNSSYRF